MKSALGLVETSALGETVGITYVVKIDSVDSDLMSSDVVPTVLGVTSALEESDFDDEFFAVYNPLGLSNLLAQAVSRSISRSDWYTDYARGEPEAASENFYEEMPMYGQVLFSFGCFVGLIFLIGGCLSCYGVAVPGIWGLSKDGESSHKKYWSSLPSVSGIRLSKASYDTQDEEEITEGPQISVSEIQKKSEVAKTGFLGLFQKYKRKYKIFQRRGSDPPMTSAEMANGDFHPL